MPPSTSAALDDWVEDVRTHLTECFSDAPDLPPVFDTLMPTGVLTIRRQAVRGITRVRVENGHLAVALEEPVSAALREAAQGERLFPARATVIHQARCRRCQQSETECGCSWILDEGVIRDVERHEGRGFFWTDRPA